MAGSSPKKERRFSSWAPQEASGLAAIDIARSMGARVIAAASSQEKRDQCLKAGADAVIDYTKEDLKTRTRELSDGGADVVFDPVGGDYSEPALRAPSMGRALPRHRVCSRGKSRASRSTSRFSTRAASWASTGEPLPSAIVMEIAACSRNSKNFLRTRRFGRQSPNAIPSSAPVRLYATWPNDVSSERPY